MARACKNLFVARSSISAERSQTFENQLIHFGYNNTTIFLRSWNKTLLHGKNVNPKNTFHLEKIKQDKVRLQKNRTNLTNLYLDEGGTIVSFINKHQDNNGTIETQNEINGKMMKIMDELYSSNIFILGNKVFDNSYSEPNVVAFIDNTTVTNKHGNKYDLQTYYICDFISYDKLYYYSIAGNEMITANKERKSKIKYHSDYLKINKNAWFEETLLQIECNKANNFEQELLHLSLAGGIPFFYGHLCHEFREPDGIKAIDLDFKDDAILLKPCNIFKE